MSEAGSPVSARRGRPGYDQQTVLTRAVELFNRQGYDATSMGDLARELGLSKSAIYHHVPSKESLLSAALDEALDSLAEAIEAAGGPGTAPVPARSAGTAAETDPATDPETAPELEAYQRLRTAVRDSVQVLVAHLPAVTLLLRVHGNSEVELAALRRRRALDEKLTRLVEAAVDEGSLRDDVPPDLISRLLFGTVNSLVEWYRPGGQVDADLLASAVTDLAFDGLAQPVRRRSPRRRGR